MKNFKVDSEGPRHIHECDDCKPEPAPLHAECNHSKPQHTPLPWRYQKEIERGRGLPDVARYHLYTGNGKYGHPATCEEESDAAFIVLAVNNFERAIRYLEIEHRKEKSQSFHTSDCDLCEFISKAEGR
jgi:hypothetical protein